jgi:hypothetical protein
MLSCLPAELWVVRSNPARVQGGSFLNLKAQLKKMRFKLPNVLIIDSLHELG